MTRTTPIVFNRSGYSWEWNPTTDRFVLRDARELEIAAAPLQPAVLLERTAPESGTATSVTVDQDTLIVVYDGVNGADRLILRMRFTHQGIWFETAIYHSRRRDEVVSVLSFADWSGDIPTPGLKSDYFVHPGASESSVLGPVIPADLGLDMTTWLGRGSNDCDDIVSAQWGLPVHYLGGFSIEGSMCARGALTEHLSAAFCLGLTAVPTGDLLLRQRRGQMSPWLRTHSDLWHHQSTGDGPLSVGASWLLTVAPTYHEAIGGYYRALVEAGVVHPRPRTPKQLETLSFAQFNTWGAQCAAGTAVEHFSEAALDSIYNDMRSSGLRAGLFVIDDKWEGEYGLLEHDVNRFPHFESFLDRVRDDGLEVGLWAAFLRCDNPASHGMGPEHMLCDAAGNPVTRGNQGHSYYLFDISQPIVRERLADRARQFMRRYRPSLVKFDFGYELPAMLNAAPQIREWGGELLLLKALELVIGAMRDIDPDVVVMYYNLSPLLANFVDLHSTDDMYLNADEYHLEANRRLFFSSLLGEVGIPSYGSGGYDWAQMPDIWLDTAIFGPVGSLGSFRGDPRDSAPTDLDIARYNGLGALTRRCTTFTVEPLRPAFLGGASGARSASWARYEGDALMAVVLRANGFDGSGTLIERGPVHSAVPTAVVSLTDQPLDRTPALGLVALAPGRVDIANTDAARATATAHLAGGRRVPIAIEPTAGGLSLDFPERSPDGAPIEWFEVTLGR